MGDELAATRRSYDEGAARYLAGIGTAIGPATEAPLDQSFLTRFGERVRAESGADRVGDLGCGPGRAAAFLRDLDPDLDVVGIDLSFGLLRGGRAAHPDLGFVQGTLSSLPLRSSSLGGVVSWYSIIHTAPERLGPVAAELARVVVGGGLALVAFQAGENDAVARSAPTYRHAPDAVAARLAGTGFDVVDRALRPAELEHETAPQVFMLFRRRSAGSGTTR